MMRPQRSDGADPRKRRKQIPWTFLYVLMGIVSIVGLFFAGLRINGVMPVEIVPYNELEHSLAAGKVDHVVVSDRDIRA